MSEKVLEILFVLVFFVVPGVVGARLAWSKGRNWLVWLVLCFCCPPTLMVCIFQSPVKEVPGQYRKCPQCGEFLKWREPSCKYCQAEIG